MSGCILTRRTKFFHIQLQLKSNLFQFRKKTKIEGFLSFDNLFFTKNCFVYFDIFKIWDILIKIIQKKGFWCIVLEYLCNIKVLRNVTYYSFYISTYVKFRFSEKAKKDWKKKLPIDLTLLSKRQTKWDFFFKFCGFLTIS